MSKHSKISAVTRASESPRFDVKKRLAHLIVALPLWVGCTAESNQSSEAGNNTAAHDGHAHDSTDNHGADHGHGHGEGGMEHDEDFGHGDHSPPPLPEDSLPEKLSETGLYIDISTKEVADKIIHYVPQYALWSDGAHKERWALLPDGTKVDNGDPNNWSVPVGSRFFKEFSIGDQRIETRLIERVGDGPRDFAFVSYLWNEEQTEAIKVDASGLPNALGTSHDIPSKQACLQCHGTYSQGGGRASRMLGFSLVQLSHADAGISSDELSEHLTEDLPSYSIPGDSTAQDALGYLHANCGNCHHDGPDRVPHVELSFWLDAEATTVEETGTWKTAVNQPNVLFNDQHVVGRIVPGHPEESSVIYRMQQRGNNAQMPPVATKSIDETGIADVAAWIRSL